MAQVTDLHISSNIPLPAPALLLSEVERSPEQAEFMADSRQHIRNILNGEDHRLLLVCGPCSIHDTKAGIEYARKLAKLAEEVKHQIYMVMRVYFEKPRTTVGWKGMIMDPRLDGSDNIPEGLRKARLFLREVLDIGLPTATELLDPITPQYIADLISWSAIGARTTESQTHRQMASGLSMPLGFKNTTTGDLLAAVNAIKAATQPQTFLGVSEQGVASAVTTSGNPDCHIILRGGDHGPNYGADDVAVTTSLLEKHGLQPSVMIDASHANCGKKHEKMPAVFSEIVRQRAAGSDHVIGAMLESNLVAGNQKFPQPIEDLTYGQSITDQCIGWETTETIVLKAARDLKAAGVAG
ncbi:MAG: 3-deoxy-7-phosphoheptulonate synthase [Akkermansiaceae bacterium]|nr:3-deoxy-7-phosphoheptulonate synthase [Akkermansiaceae bacterium]